ncbi:MAG: hypothetical protein KAT34_02920 [Candidatus Aminicenantes bacterium]|nr:hypothetical protein [Candidatus Aminicenantes bacterium]
MKNKVLISILLIIIMLTVQYCGPEIIVRVGQVNNFYSLGRLYKNHRHHLSCNR